MKNALYIVKTQDNWYQLRCYPEHIVLGCGKCVQVLLNTAKRYVLRYRKSSNFKRAVRSMEYNYTLREDVMIRRQYEYEHRDEYLDGLLQDTISSALIKVREDTPLKRVKKRLVGIKQSTVPVVEKVEQEVKSTRGLKSTIKLKRLSTK